MDTQELTGRALDAAVAVEVMGWVEDSAIGGWVCRTPESEQRCIPGPPRFSTDGSAMLAIIEEMGRRNFRAELTRDDSGACSAAFEHVNSARYLDGDWYAEAPTLPEAVCRAALAVVRAQKGGRH